MHTVSNLDAAKRAIAALSPDDLPALLCSIGATVAHLLHSLPPLPAGPCPDGLYRADSGEIVRIHHGRPEPAF